MMGQNSSALVPSPRGRLVPSPRGHPSAYVNTATGNGNVSPLGDRSAAGFYTAANAAAAPPAAPPAAQANSHAAANSASTAQTANGNKRGRYNDP